MSASTRGDSGGRDSFFAAAVELLGRSGPRAITIEGLCSEVGVTKGSFYYHFEGIGQFVEAFARRWEQAFQASFETFAAEPDPLRRVELIFSSTMLLPHGVEAAFRSWSLPEPAVATTLRQITDSGERLLAQTLAELLGDPDTAVVLAHMGVSLVIGLQQRTDPVDRERFERCALLWLRDCVGLEVDGEPRARQRGAHPVAAGLSHGPEPIRFRRRSAI